MVVAVAVAVSAINGVPEGQNDLRLTRSSYFSRKADILPQLAPLKPN